MIKSNVIALAGREAGHDPVEGWGTAIDSAGGRVAGTVSRACPATDRGGQGGCGANGHLPGRELQTDRYGAASKGRNWLKVMR